MESKKTHIVNRKESTYRAAAIPVKVYKSVKRNGMQASMRVSSPQDPAEREAVSVADRVMKMQVPQNKVSCTPGGVYRLLMGNEKNRQSVQAVSPSIQRFTSVYRIISRRENNENVTSPEVHNDIRQNMSLGQPLPEQVRSDMEPRFNADFRNVKIHTGERSARMNDQLQARAFTVGNQIFFGKDQYNPNSLEGRSLLAHELTHTIQQGAAVQRSEAVSVRQQSTNVVQRLGVNDIISYLAGRIRSFPGFNLLTMVLGVNPFDMSRVTSTVQSVFQAVLDYLPDKGTITRALNNYNIFNKVADWVRQQFTNLGLSATAIWNSIKQFINSLGISDALNLSGVWNRFVQIITTPVNRVLSLARSFFSAILNFIRKAILKPLGNLMQGRRGYPLLKAILGFDPVTNEPYPRTPETLVGGFMILIGREDIWNNIRKANAVSRAFALVQQTVSGVLGILRAIPGQLLAIINSLGLSDLVNITGVLGRVAGIFNSAVVSIILLGSNLAFGLLLVVVEVVAPGLVPYLRMAGPALRAILNNPVGFVQNLVNAIKAGFIRFGANILSHLMRGILGWLTGILGNLGIPLPRSLDLREIIAFVFRLLGISWQNIRKRLVTILGEETVIYLETAFDLVKLIIRVGPMAAWEVLALNLQNLREIVLQSIVEWIRQNIVMRIIPRIIAMFNPAGAFIQAIIAIYHAIMALMNILRQVTGIIASVISLIMTNVAAVAGAVENILSRTISLTIQFLSRMLGLGNLAERIRHVVEITRHTVDNALDRVVQWLVTKARSLIELFRKRNSDTGSFPNVKVRAGL